MRGAWGIDQEDESLTSEERAALPECPAGQALTDLDEGALARAVGGALLALDDYTCICSRFTGPITLTTTRGQLTTTIIQNTREQTILQLDQALERAAVTLRRAREGGWRCGMGLAGIGYGLLRLAAPEQVPSVLTLALP
jgi:mersacidin/lichenicidin family type 2 lantibiotic